MKLTLSNFQIHQKPATLEIPENETTYVEGDSDIGKSSRLRAMRWLCENKPDGGSFVTFKQPRGTNSLVRLEMDGRVIERERGKSKNTYRMDGETFEAFGRSVPEPIAKFLALSPYAFQLQGEVPFLIGASPTDAAKILSEACGLGVIDTATAFVKGKKTVADAEIRKSEILLESAQARLAQATEQLPLADALEAAAKVGEEAQSLTDKETRLEDAIQAEPEGEPLDVTAVRGVAAAARFCEAERGTLTTMTMRLCGAIRCEPQGVLQDVSAVRPAIVRANAIAEASAALVNRAMELQERIADEPKSTVMDVAAAVATADAIHALVPTIDTLVNMVTRLRHFISVEPQGEVRDVSGVAAVIARCWVVVKERSILDTMRLDMQGALMDEPQGELMDTSELLKQRAQIRVCPTCQRELP